MNVVPDIHYRYLLAYSMDRISGKTEKKRYPVEQFLFKVHRRHRTLFLWYTTKIFKKLNKNFAVAGVIGV